MTDSVTLSEASEALEAVESTVRLLHPYPECCESGCSWLPEMPAHWTPQKLGFVASMRGGSTPSKNNDAYWDGDVPWVSPKDMKVSRITDTTDHLSDLALEETGIRLIDPPVVLMVVRGMILAHSFPIAVTTVPVTINQDMKALTPKGCSVEFLHYLLSGLKNIVCFAIDDSAHGTKVLRLATWKHLPVWLPGAEEQERIVEFLDRETAKIDGLVAKKRRLIELLKEKRTALISHAVTKGLNPDTPMKPSGTDWLDEYPAHWAGLPLKRWVATKITDGPHETPALVSDGVDFVSAEAVQEGRVNFDSRRGYITAELHQEYCRKCRPQRDDIFLVKSGATTGKLAYIDTDREFSVWSPLALVRADRNKVTPEFLFAVLHADYMQSQIQRTWSAGTQPNISMGAIERLLVVVPPLTEQDRIMAFLTSECGGFDSLIVRVSRAIDVLYEYRSALISAAVTGKIDVRGEVAA